MVKKLVKAPLLAILYGSMLAMGTLVVPYSEGMRNALNSADVWRIDYLYMILFGLWLSIGMILALGACKSSGMIAPLMTTISVVGCACVLPMCLQFLQGEFTGVMTTADNVWTLVLMVVCTVLLMVVTCMIAGKGNEETPPAATYKLKLLPLIIRIVVLPFIFVILYFICWIFLAWRSNDVRLFYAAGAANQGFVQTMIDILLTNAKIVPLQMLRGLLYALFLLPLLLQIPGKRVDFLVISVFMVASGALIMLLPNPVLPHDVRIVHLVEHAVLLVVYGALAGILLHTSYVKVGDAPQPAQQTPQGSAAGRSTSDLRKAEAARRHARASQR